MARKFVLVVVVVFLSTVGVAVQILVALGTIIFATFGQLIMGPFRLPRLEALERFSLYGNAILLYLAMFFEIPGVSSSAQTILAFLLVIVNVFVMAKIILAFVREHVASFLKLLDTDKDGWITPEDVERAGKKAKGLVLKLKVWIFTRFFNWARAGGPTRQSFAAYITPYGMIGIASSTAKAAEHPDRWMEIFSLVGVDKSMPSISAKSQAMLTAYKRKREEERAQLRAEYKPQEREGSMMSLGFVGRTISAAAKSFTKSFSRGHPVAPSPMSHLRPTDHPGNYFEGGSGAPSRGMSKVSVRFNHKGQGEAKDLESKGQAQPPPLPDPGVAAGHGAPSGWDQLLHEAAGEESSVQHLGAFDKVRREETEEAKQQSSASSRPASIRVTPSLPLDDPREDSIGEIQQNDAPHEHNLDN